MPTLTPLSPPAVTDTPASQAWPITDPGCCARPAWSEDGREVLFLDDPPGDRPLGVYAVPAEGGPASLARQVFSSEDVAAGLPDTVSISDVRREFPVSLASEAVRLSPDEDRVAWTEGSGTVANLDRRLRSVWVAGRGEAQGRRVATIFGGGLVGWAGDQSLILSGRFDLGGPGGMWTMPWSGGEPALLFSADRPRGAVLSPSGDWVVFYLAFDPDPSRNGVWVVRTDGAAVHAIGSLASYRWSTDRLFYLPFDPSDEGPALIGFDPHDGRSEVVLPAPAFRGGIAANDWDISPSGFLVVYRSAADGRLWVIDRSS